MNKTLLIGFLVSTVLIATPLRGQDSTIYLSVDAFYRQVIDHHPLVRQALLLDEQARQEIRLARGNFDPKIDVTYGEKEFQDKSYYNSFLGQLSLPSRSPVTPKMGYERTTGQLLNPSDKIPGGKQFYAGFQMALGRGLFTDERRTILNQAELMKTMLAADRTKAINKVLLEAAVAYWSWQYHYQSVLISGRALVVAEDILRRVKINYDQGESSMLDTIQAGINRRTRQLEFTEATLAFRNAGLEVSNFLWNDQLEPVVIKSGVIPKWEDPDTGQDLGALIDLARTNHPDLVRLRTRIDQLGFDRQLAVENLKPRLDLNYALLTQPGAPEPIDWRNDYKFGLDFSMPLFLRKERSRLKLTELRIEQTELEETRQQRDILISLEQVFNEITATKSLRENQRLMITQYERLLEGELLNLQQGESDLFRINQQQDKLLQSQIKGAKLDAEIQKQFAYLWWSAGTTPLSKTENR